MAYKVTDTVIVDQNRNISSIGIATFAGPVLIGGGSSTGTVSQPLQVLGTNGAYIGGNLGIGSTNPTSKLWVSGDIYNTGIHTAQVLSASKDPGTGIGTDFTNSLFGNGWRVSAPGSTTYYKLATLPPGGSGTTFDHLTINGILGAWTSGNQTPFEITFSNRGSFNYKYVSYGSVRSDVRIIGISTNSSVEIWAQHQSSQFTKLVYNIANSIQAIVVSNPTSTTTAPTGTTVFDSSTVTPRFIINESDNVGVGTATPTSKLSVVGDVLVTGVVTATTFSGTLSGYATSAGIATYATTSGVSTSVIGGIGSLSQLQVTGVSTFTNGPVLIGGGTSTGTPGQVLQVSGINSSVYIGGNLGIGSTNPLQKLHVLGNLLVAAGSSTGQHITQKAYELNSGTLSWEGTAGQLFSITNNLTTGSIFSVNDVSGIPSIDVDASGTISLGAFGGNIGIGTITPSSKLSVVGDVLVSGVTTASRFVSNVAQGTAPISVASSTVVTNLNADFLDGLDSLYFTNASNLSSGIVPSARITASSGDFTVGQNLNVTGNITIGGTTAILNATTLQIKDKDIVLGITTNASNQDVSTDITANHGGVAIASTEGTPLIDIVGGVGTDTIPSTYKQIMWLKSGSWTGLGTDAWLFNYGVGIGSTQVPNGVRLAVGGVQFTQNDLAVVRNINASGVITATSGFSGNASSATYATSAGIATYATSAGIATYATNAGIATYATNAGIATYATSAGIATYATNAGIATYATSAGIATYATNAGIATYATNAGIATYATNAGIATYATSAGIATYATNAGIATYATSAGIATYATNAGIATYATSSGIATYATSAGIATYATTAGIATYATNAGIATYATSAGIATYATSAGIATYATTAGIATNVIGGIGSITQLQVTGISTFTNGPVLIGSGTSTGTASQPLQVTGGAYVSGNLGVGVADPQTRLAIDGVLEFTGTTNNIRIGDNTTGSSSGIDNIFLGGFAGQSSLNANGNLFLGSNSGFSNIGGSYNTFLGGASGAGNDSGNFNVYFGALSGLSTSASYKVILGSGGIGAGVSLFDAPNTTKDKQFAVGVNTGTTSEYWLVGNENFNIGIGTTNPTSKLTVTGNALVSGITTTQILNVGTGGTVITTTSGGFVGIGTASPAFTADIAGDARVTSTNKMRFGGTAGTTNFYIQYNSTTNSLDFVAG